MAVFRVEKTKDFTAIMKSQPKIWLPRLYKVVPACQSMTPWQALFLSR